MTLPEPTDPDTERDHTDPDDLDEANAALSASPSREPSDPEAPADTTRGVGPGRMADGDEMFGVDEGDALEQEMELDGLDEDDYR
jgi:hypothetical protein